MGQKSVLLILNIFFYLSVSSDIVQTALCVFNGVQGQHEFEHIARHFEQTETILKNPGLYTVRFAHLGSLLIVLNSMHDVFGRFKC